MKLSFASLAAVALLMVSSGGAAPINDYFTNAVVLSGASGTLNTSTVGGTLENGEHGHAGDYGGHSIWFQWVAPMAGMVTFDTFGSSFDTLLDVEAGASIDDLCLITANDDANDDTSLSQVLFSVLPGQPFNICVDGYGGAKGDVTLNWQILAPPPNDSFSTPTLLSGLAGFVSGTNVGASKELGEPDHADNPGGASVWFDWTAPTNGLVAFNTFHSDFDTIMGVYTGPDVAALSLVASNDEYVVHGYYSGLTFTATAGTVYHIAVDSFVANQPAKGDDSGDYVLQWSMNPPPANDSFNDATTLPSSGSLNTTTFFATKEPGEPNHSANAGGHSVWYRWTATASGPVFFDITGSQIKTLLAIYTGANVSSLSLVVSNRLVGQFNAVSYRDRLTFSAVEGQTYDIAVDGLTLEQGFVTLNWGLDPPVLGAIRAGANLVLNWSAAGFQLQATTDLPSPPATAVWTTLPGVSPVTLPAGLPRQFFRLISP